MTDINFNFSPIKEYYTDKSILITGVTGLVGKVLLYKILKSIETVNKVYVIIREKKNKNASERLSELFEKSKGLFDDIDANAYEKVVMVNASLTAVGMDLSETHRSAIINNVSIVFHSAADVTFDTKLKEQVLINVGGTKEIIGLCRQLKQFDALVYVSTAYSSPLEMVVNEQVYDSERNPLEVLEKARDPTITMKTCDYLGKYPNTYSYTKNLAENLVKEEFEQNKTPVTIVRPGIVLNSISEPKCGWFDSITSIMGVLILLGTGLVKIFPYTKETTFDLIPVDIVANTCIASAHRLYLKKNRNKLMVYNCNSACLGAMNFGQYLEFGLSIIKQYPLRYTLRPIVPILLEFSSSLFTPIQFLLETCFAYLVDLLLLLIGRKRVAVKKLRLYHTMSRLTRPYVGRQWYFTHNNMIRLSQQLSGSDRHTFDCDIKAIDWIKYVTESFFESRKLLLKEKDGDIDRAKLNIKYTNTIYTIINHVLLCLTLYALIKFTSISSLLNASFEMFTSFEVIHYFYYLILTSAVYNAILNFV